MEDDSWWMSFFLWFGLRGRPCSNFLYTRNCAAKGIATQHAGARCLHGHLLLHRGEVGDECPVRRLKHVHGHLQVGPTYKCTHDVYRYIRIHIYVYIYIQICICVCLYMYIYVFIYICIYVYVCMIVCIHMV